MRVKGAKKRVAIALAAALVVSGIGYVPKADAEKRDTSNRRLQSGSK